MRSAFTIGEIVTISRLDGWPKQSQVLLGARGRVEAFAPKGPLTGSGEWGWEVCLWVYSLEEVWCFDETELASTGQVELVENGSSVLRPLSATTRALTEPPPITIRAYLDSDNAESIEGSLAAAVRRAGRVRKVTVRRSDEDGASTVVDCFVWPAGGASEFFESLVNGGRSENWIRKVDDGWSCDFWWTRIGSEPFLGIDHVQDAAVSMNPWDDPTPRRVPPDRTTESGLPT